MEDQRRKEQQEAPAEVHIVYDRTGRIMSLLYAGFLRFLGLYVRETFLPQYTKDQMDADHTEHRAVLYIRAEKDAASLPVKPCVCADTDSCTDILLTSEDAFGRCGEKMADVLEQLSAACRALHRDFPSREIRALLPVFLKNRVAEAVYVLQWYRKAPDAQSILDRLLDTLRQVQKAAPWHSRYTDYAMLFCMTQINRACYAVPGRALQFPIQDIIDRCRTYGRHYPWSENADVLSIQAACRSDNYVDHVLFTSFKVMHARQCPYALDAAWYAAGTYRRFPKQGEAGQKTKQLCERAYRIRKDYRTANRVAECCPPDQTISYYRECLEDLRMRMPAGLTPVEMEYYYKVSVLAAVWYIQKGKDYQAGIRYGEDALRFYRKELEADESGYFYRLFGDKKETYQAASRCRIDRRTAWANLGNACRMTGDQDASDAFWELAGTWPERK